jgi:hypothetical protein
VYKATPFMRDAGMKRKVAVVYLLIYVLFALSITFNYQIPSYRKELIARPSAI